jgi:hypothetical protein
MAGDQYTAFAGHRLLANGASEHVAAAAKAAQDAGETHVLIFEDATGEQAELDPREPTPTIAGRTAPPPKAGRGRPKLGVVAREVTLLPRHWDWLATQPGGASAALRRLVEDASRQAPDRTRQVQEVLYKVMTALAGDLPGYEEAVRALFAGDEIAFAARAAAWPEDLRQYLSRLSGIVSSRTTG